MELQREIKEITTDGSVHELLQKLLRAETVIQERARREKTLFGDMGCLQELFMTEQLSSCQKCCKKQLHYWA